MRVYSLLTALLVGSAALAAPAFAQGNLADQKYTCTIDTMAQCAGDFCSPSKPTGISVEYDLSLQAWTDGIVGGPLTIEGDERQLSGGFREIQFRYQLHNMAYRVTIQTTDGDSQPILFSSLASSGGSNLISVGTCTAD